jgi:hypothetical protein
MLGERAPEPESDMTDAYWKRFEQSAIDAWNRRAVEPAAIPARTITGSGTEADPWRIDPPIPCPDPMEISCKRVLELKCDYCDQG